MIKSAITIAFILLSLPCFAQDIEPRRWSHLPLGSNFGGGAYAYTDNDTFTIGCSLQW